MNLDFYTVPTDIMLDLIGALADADCSGKQIAIVAELYRKAIVTIVQSVTDRITAELEAQPKRRARGPNKPKVIDASESHPPTKRRGRPPKVQPAIGSNNNDFDSASS